MFTGLIEFTGKTLWLKRTTSSTQLAIRSSKLSRRVRSGDSVSVNGCCLTVTSHRDENVHFELLEETLDLTNLKNLRPDSKVNLERALRADGRLGGHFVQGHIDCTTNIRNVHKKGGDLRIDLDLPPEYAHYVAYKGSIAINGVSLTVADVNAQQFSVWIIPHTLKNTNLQDLDAGDLANLEFDILAKYTDRLLQGSHS